MSKVSRFCGTVCIAANALQGSGSHLSKANREDT